MQDFIFAKEVKMGTYRFAELACISCAPAYSEFAAVTKYLLRLVSPLPRVECSRTLMMNRSMVSVSRT